MEVHIVYEPQKYLTQTSFLYFRLPVVPTSVKSIWNADTQFTERICDFCDCSHNDIVAPEHCKHLSVSVSQVSIPLTSITSTELVCDPSSRKSERQRETERETERDGER